MKRLVTLLISLTAAPALQAENQSLPNTPPPGVEAETQMEPEVTIIRREGETVEEYRLNGRLYMIKVTPDKGPEYFLIDSDGNGSLDARRSEIDPQLLIPSWMIFKW